MQNGPHEYAVDHTSFYVISKLFTQTFLIGRGDVTFLHIAYVKSTKNVGKLTCVFGRFKNPFFLWLIQILKAVTMIMVTAIAFFWSFMRNPAIGRAGPGRCVPGGHLFARIFECCTECRSTPILTWGGWWRGAVRPLIMRQGGANSSRTTLWFAWSVHALHVSIIPTQTVLVGLGKRSNSLFIIQ